PILKLYKRLKNYNNSLLVVIEKLAAYFFARCFVFDMYLVNDRNYTMYFLYSAMAGGFKRGIKGKTGKI
ncbi:MAG: hypothetical protein SWO11_23535, partial [Thermodesulfobacteriota bacterium]|nr:hypothetical protein [Thermodesulfobacteriota bacterium]